MNTTVARSRSKSHQILETARFEGWHPRGLPKPGVHQRMGGGPLARDEPVSPPSARLETAFTRISNCPGRPAEVIQIPWNAIVCKYS